MHAERMILETDQEGHLTQQPKLPPNARVEAIFLVLEERPPPVRHRPPAELAGKVKIHGDIIAPAIPEEDWDILK